MEATMAFTEAAVIPASDYMVSAVVPIASMVAPGFTAIPTMVYMAVAYMAYMETGVLMEFMALVVLLALRLFMDTQEMALGCMVKLVIIPVITPAFLLGMFTAALGFMQVLMRE